MYIYAKYQMRLPSATAMYTKAEGKSNTDFTDQKCENTVARREKCNAGKFSPNVYHPDFLISRICIFRARGAN